MTSPRQSALVACLEVALAQGRLDLGLRAFERETGISARMLTHHFGGNDGLKSALVEEIEARLRTEVTIALRAGDETAFDIARAFSDPDRAPLRRLLRASLRDALGGDPASAAVLAAERGRWREALDSSNVELDLFVLVGGAVDAMLADTVDQDAQSQTETPS